MRLRQTHTHTHTHTHTAVHVALCIVRCKVLFFSRWQRSVLVQSTPQSSIVCSAPHPLCCSPVMLSSAHNARVARSHAPMSTNAYVSDGRAFLLLFCCFLEQRCCCEIFTSDPENDDGEVASPLSFLPHQGKSPLTPSPYATSDDH